MAKIIRVEILGEETKAVSGVGRAIVGSILFGGVGAIVGAQTAKDKEYTKFEVTYSNGKSEVVKFKKGSMTYNNLMSIREKNLKKMRKELLND